MLFKGHGILHWLKYHIKPPFLYIYNISLKELSLQKIINTEKWDVPKIFTPTRVEIADFLEISHTR